MCCSNIEVHLSFSFYKVPDVPYRTFKVRLCTCISEMTLGALIGAGALKRANTVRLDNVRTVNANVNGALFVKDKHSFQMIAFP